MYEENTRFHNRLNGECNGIITLKPSNLLIRYLLIKLKCYKLEVEKINKKMKKVKTYNALNGRDRSKVVQKNVKL